jgi:hypothetical protein
MPASPSRMQQWLRAWVGTAGAAGGAEDSAAPALVAVDSIRCALVRSLAGCSEQHRARAADSVMRAGNAAELWVVRCQLYDFLARDLGEAEANRRLSAVQPLFVGHVEQAQRRAGQSSLH